MRSRALSPAAPGRVTPVGAGPGDPLFGRGGEESAALGVPVAHRGLARGAIFVTGHAASGVGGPAIVVIGEVVRLAELVPAAARLAEAA
jgi:siroheme synthase